MNFEIFDMTYWVFRNQYGIILFKERKKEAAPNNFPCPIDF